MSGFKYTVKLEKEYLKEIFIDAKSVTTLGDLKRAICNHSTVYFEALRIWANCECITNNPDNTPLATLGISASDNIVAKEIWDGLEREQGRLNTVETVNKTQFQNNPNKLVQEVNGIPVQSNQINLKQHQKKQMDSDDYEPMKDPANMTLQQKLNYCPRPKPKPEPKWPQLSQISLQIKRQEKIQSLAKKLKEEGWQNANEWAQIGHGRQAQIKAFKQSNHGQLISKEVCDFMEKFWIKRIIRHYMKCKPIMRHKQALLTTYGLIDFVFGKATEYYPALELMQTNRKKLFYEIAAVQWFCHEPIVSNKVDEEAYINTLSSFTDQNIVTQVSRVTKNKQRALKLVQMSQNDLQIALTIFTKGEGIARECNLLKIEERQQKDLGIIAQWQQQPYLFIWLMNSQNYLLRLRLFADPCFLQVFTLSMKHLCPGLFKLLVKHRSYISKIIQKRPPKLYREQPEF